MIPSTIVLMGVCGCGKTLVGQMLTKQIGGVFEDADNFHTEAAKDKMRSGTPLTDEDRWPWYARLRARIEEMREETPHYVLACSALKLSYRDRLRENDGPDQFAMVFLDGTFELIHSRMAKRKGHYMPVSLLESQFTTLERPADADALRISIEPGPKRIAANIVAQLSKP